MAMDVKLLNHTPNPELAIATAARICYSPDTVEDLQKKMTPEREASVLSTILSSGHDSALEHASFTFAIDGISRACSHQLVRHRLASYNQQSQRYVAEKDASYVIPPSVIDAGDEAISIFNSAIDTTMDAYHRLIELGVHKEDARYLLTNATNTAIIVTMNARELRHFFTLRCCNRAQWEIRELADKMLELVEPIAPRVFENAGPECRRGNCPEGKMTCGSPR